MSRPFFMHQLQRKPLLGTSVNINVREDLITLRVDLPVWDRVFIVNRLVEVGNGRGQRSRCKRHEGLAQMVFALRASREHHVKGAVRKQ